jgi:predicted alpha/beta hydrolase family esterase
MFTMPRQVLFIQGGGKGAHVIDAKLAESLQHALGTAYQLRYPAMPDEDAPSYANWKSRITDELDSLGDGIVLVGHSMGAALLINALAEEDSKRSIAGIFLIAAPFVGSGGWKSEDFTPPNDLGGQLPRGVPIYLYHGRADETVPIAHVDLYARAIPQATIRRLDGRDHQLGNDAAVVADDIRSLVPRRTGSAPR